MLRNLFRTQHFHRFSGVLAFAGPFALYCACAYRDVGYWDIGEMDTVPYILGIAHPPGLPLFTLLGWAFTHLVVVGSVAFRMSLLSALAMSLSAYIALVLVRELSGDGVAALGAAWLFGAGGIAWGVATRADVHAAEMLCFACTLWLFARWSRGGITRDLYLGAAAFGLTVAMHPIGLFLLAGITVFVISRAPDIGAASLARAGLIAVCSCALWFVYLPLRSAYVTSAHLDPLLALGYGGAAFWDYDHPAVFSNFLALISGSDVNLRGPLRLELLGTLLGDLTPLGALLALTGGIVFARRNALLTSAFVASCAGSALFACGFRDESDVGRYFLPLAFVGAVFAGIGLAWLRTTLGAFLATLVVGLTIAWLAGSQHQFFGQPGDDRPRREVNDILAHTPDDAILIAGWTLAPPLAYVDYVEHGTGQRSIVPAWYGEIAYQLDGWVRARPVYVVGRVGGSVAGFRLERLPTHTLLYHVVRE